MKISENLGTLLLGIWLLATGLISLTNISIPIISNILPLFAFIAGLLILLGSVKLPDSLGVIILAVWLILKGLTPFIAVSIPFYGLALNLFAIGAGLLIILRR